MRDLEPVTMDTTRQWDERSRATYRGSVQRQRIQEVQTLLTADKARLQFLLRKHGVININTLRRPKNKGVPVLWRFSFIFKHRNCEDCENISICLSNIDKSRAKIRSLKAGYKPRAAHLRHCPFCASTFRSQVGKSRHIKHFHGGA
jgi:hypothetical protein